MKWPWLGGVLFLLDDFILGLTPLFRVELRLFY